MPETGSVCPRLRLNRYSVSTGISVPEKPSVHLFHRFCQLHVLREVQEVTASIFLGLLKGHYFADGNKRTACAVFLWMCLENSLKTDIDEDMLYDVTLRAAAGGMDVGQLAGLLFS